MDGADGDTSAGNASRDIGSGAGAHGSDRLVLVDDERRQRAARQRLTPIAPGWRAG